MQQIIPMLFLLKYAIQAGAALFTGLFALFCVIRFIEYSVGIIVHRFY